MRYAVLADIHSNAQALAAIVEDARTQRVDQWLCAGDLVGYGAEPEACLAMLHAHQPVTVAGNHDLACLGKVDPNRLTSAGRQVVLWTRDRLGFAELDALRRLPMTAGDDAVSVVHGSPQHPDRFAGLSDVGRAADSATACRTPYCVVGHTHWPIAYLCRGRPWRVQVAQGSELAELRVPNEPDVRYLLNPGSVGQPRDGDPRASYAVLDTDRGTWAVRRIVYDVERAQRAIRDAGLPELLADRLAVGR